jgi:predicted Zn finger-like uncharacterized protein
MILTCPACATKYNIADSALGEAGRKVRCASCGHKWWQGPELETEVETAQVESFFAAVAGENAGLEELSSALPSREIPLAAPVDDEDDGYRHRSSAASPRQAVVTEATASSSAMAWGIVAAVTILLLLALYLPRAKIMAAWPNSVRLYRTVGLAPKLVGVDLEIRDARAVVQETAAGRTLTIEGEIANTGNQIRQPPDLQAVQTNNSETVGSWIFPSGVTSLSVGKSQHFTASFPDKAEAGGNIVLTFAAKGPDGAKNDK